MQTFEYIKTNYIQLFIWIIILGAIAFAPSYQIIPKLGLYDAKRTIQIGLLILLIAHFLLLNRNKFNEISKLFYTLSYGVKFSVTLFLLLGTISTLHAKYPIQAFTELWLISSLIVLVFFTAHTYLQNRYLFLKLLIVTFTILAGVYSINFIISYSSTLVLKFGELWPSQSKISGREFLGFTYVRFFNQIQTLTLFTLLLPYFYFSDKNLVWKVVPLVLGSLWCMFIFASGARGSMLAIVFAVACVALLFPKKIFPWIKVFILVSLVGFILNFLLFELVTGESLQRLSRTHSSGRLVMWSLAFDNLLYNPLLGIGPMQLADYDLGISNAHPHNGYLQILVEWGIPAFVLASFVAINGFIKFINLGSMLDEDKKAFQIYITLLLTIIAAAVHTFVSGVIVMPLSQLILAIIIGWALGFYFKIKSPDPTQNIDYIKLNQTLKWFLVIPMIGLLSILIHDIPNLESSKTKYMNFTGESSLKPRIWQQGKIVKGLNELKDDTLISY